MKAEELFKLLKTTNVQDKAVIIESLQMSLNEAFVPELEKGDERPCEEADFQSFKIENEINLHYLHLIFQDLITNQFFDFTQPSSVNLNEFDILTSVLIILGENHEISHWNTPTTVTTCQELLKSFSTLFNGQKLEQIMLLKKGSDRIFKELLLKLRPKLLVTTWKKYPAAVACYKWTLHLVHQPNLSLYLECTLPTALILVDDFVTDNRIIGVECLHHIINNITASELIHHCHGDVIYKALEPLLRSRDGPLLQILIPSLVSLLIKLESHFRDKDDETKWSRFDDVFEIYLENMELEHLISLRDAYAKNLPVLIKSSGIRIIRWSSRLLRIFQEYFEVAANHNDFKTINYCLEALENYLEISKPVMHLCSDVLLFMLCKILYDITRVKEIENNEVKERTVKCIQIVLCQFPKSEKEELKNLLMEKFFNDDQSCNFLNFL